MKANLHRIRSTHFSQRFNFSQCNPRGAGRGWPALRQKRQNLMGECNPHFERLRRGDMGEVRAGEASEPASPFPPPASGRHGWTGKFNPHPQPRFAGREGYRYCVTLCCGKSARRRRYSGSGIKISPSSHLQYVRTSTPIFSAISLCNKPAFFLISRIFSGMGGR